MIKSVFVPLSDTRLDANVIRAAITLAAQVQAEVSLLHGARLPIPSESWSAMPELLIISEYPSIRQNAKQKAEQLRTRMKEEKVPVVVEEVETYDFGYDDMAAEMGRCADLILAPSCAEGDEDWATAIHLFQALLSKSGRPVLAIPPKAHLDMPFSRIVVAWKSTREAARALHDALPFLQEASMVDVLHVVEPGDPAQLPGPDPETYLERRGIPPRRTRKVSPNTVAVGDAILLHAHACEAGLIVAGGYGHSKLREWALGGATRDLFKKSQIPVLFSH